MSREQRNRLRLWIAIVVAIVSLISLYFRMSLTPVAERLIATQVDNQASDAINLAIGEQVTMGGIAYDRMVSIEKNGDGTVAAVRTNIAEINRLKSEILQRVDSKLNMLSTEELRVPFGSVFLPELFSGEGPSMFIRVLAVRTSDAVFRNSFQSAGINQTLHQIFIDIHVNITILTWSGVQEIAVDSAVLAAETVIVGTVPTTYFGMEETP